MVLACARYPMDAGTVSVEGVDWERVFEVAQSLGVAALVVGNLGAHSREKLPAAVADKLQRLRHEAMVLYVRTAARLEQVVGWFEAEGLETLVLKGLPLAAQLYESPLLRHSVDMDIMVHPSDVPRAWRMLKARGFRPLHDFDERQQAALIRGGFAQDFFAADRGPAVDLHWGVPRHLCPLDVGQAWKRAVEVRVDRRCYRTLSAEDHLLFLCYHPVKHCYGDLRSVCDIAGILRVSGDWDYISKLARRRGHARIVWTGICLAQELLDATVPEAIRREMAGCPAVAELARAISGRLFGRMDGWLRESQTAWGVRMLVGGWWKTRYLLTKVFEPNEEDFAWLSLPQVLFFTYYGLRFVRLPWRYAGIVRRLRQRQGDVDGNYSVAQ